MYAIIKTGGKQYTVREGDIIDVELLHTDAGAQVEFSDVLFANDGSKTQIGSPAIADFLVYGEVMEIVKGEKVKGLKYKASHNQCRTWGHRQKKARVKITGIGSKRHSKGDKHGT